MKKLIKLFRGNKVNYKEGFEAVTKRLISATEERDNYLRELNNIKFEIECIKNKYEKLEIKYKEIKKSNKELLHELDVKNENIKIATNIINDLNKELFKEKRKPKKSVKNYNIKSEKELF